MACHKNIENITNGFWLKRTRAEREIRDCTATWVVEGVSVRNLTPSEMIDAMNKRSQEMDRTAGPLPGAEIHGFHRSPRANMEHRLIMAAFSFAAGQPGY